MTGAARTVVALRGGRFAVAVVREGVAGYSVDVTKTADTWRAAWDAAHADNEAAGITPEAAWRIVESSMGASRAAGIRWGPCNE